MKTEVYDAGPPYVFRFRKNGKYAIDELLNNYIFFPNRDALNDPFDSMPEAIKLSDDPMEINQLQQRILDSADNSILRNYIKTKMSIKDLYEFAYNKIPEFVNSFGIACFSMYFQNLPLWAGYANNHKGACIQYDTSKDREFFDRLKPINYVEELKEREFLPFTNEQGIIEAFFEKSIVWDYEKELRLLKESKGRIFHKKEAVRSVILGYHASSNFTRNIIRAIKRNYEHVSVFKMIKPDGFNKYPLEQLY